MELRGVIKKITPEITVGANATPKQSIIVETMNGGKFEDAMMFDFVGEEKVANVRALHEGDIVKVSYNSRVTEYNGRDYNNINGWRVDIETKKPDAPVRDGGDFDQLPF